MGYWPNPKELIECEEPVFITTWLLGPCPARGGQIRAERDSEIKSPHINAMVIRRAFFQRPLARDRALASTAIILGAWAVGKWNSDSLRPQAAGLSTLSRSFP